MNSVQDTNFITNLGYCVDLNENKNKCFCQHK